MSEPIPILDYLKNLKIELSEAEWNDNVNRIDFLHREIKRVQCDIDRGEMWEIPF